MKNLPKELLTVYQFPEKEMPNELSKEFLEIENISHLFENFSAYSSRNSHEYSSGTVSENFSISQTFFFLKFMNFQSKLLKGFAMELWRIAEGISNGIVKTQKKCRRNSQSNFRRFEDIPLTICF